MQPLHSQQPGIYKWGCIHWSSSPRISVSSWYKIILQVGFLFFCFWFCDCFVAFAWHYLPSPAFYPTTFQIHRKQPNQFDISACFSWTENLSTPVSTFSFFTRGIKETNTTVARGFNFVTYFIWKSNHWWPPLRGRTREAFSHLHQTL